MPKELPTLEMAGEANRESESTAAMIPSQGAMDRFIRYEVHLSREFDRTLDRLERAQRMRRGLPGPPTLNLNIG